MSPSVSLMRPCNCASPLTLCCLSGPLSDQSGRRYDWHTAGEVIPQHSLHTLPLRPARRVSERTTDQAGSHLYVIYFIIAAHISWNVLMLDKHEPDTSLWSLVQCPFHLRVNWGFRTSPTAPWGLFGMLPLVLSAGISSPTGLKMEKPRRWAGSNLNESSIWYSHLFLEDFAVRLSSIRARKSDDDDDGDDQYKSIFLA